MISGSFWGPQADKEAPGGLYEEFPPSFVQIRLSDTEIPQILRLTDKLISVSVRV